MSIFDVKIQGLTSGTDVLGGVANKVVLVVNVASKCGLTPQYTGLEALHNEFAGQGFSVVGVPCNQFGAQEPGSAEEITTFCSGDIRWNFEKFLVGKDGTTVVRFGPMVAPDDAALRAAITKALS